MLHVSWLTTGLAGGVSAAEDYQGLTPGFNRLLSKMPYVPAQPQPPPALSPPLSTMPYDPVVPPPSILTGEYVPKTLINLNPPMPPLPSPLLPENHVHGHPRTPSSPARPPRSPPPPRPPPPSPPPPRPPPRPPRPPRPPHPPHSPHSPPSTNGLAGLFSGGSFTASPPMPMLLDREESTSDEEEDEPSSGDHNGQAQSPTSDSSRERRHEKRSDDDTDRESSSVQRTHVRRVGRHVSGNTKFLLFVFLPVAMAAHSYYLVPWIVRLCIALLRL